MIYIYIYTKRIYHKRQHLLLGNGFMGARSLFFARFYQSKKHRLTRYHAHPYSSWCIIYIECVCIRPHTRGVRDPKVLLSRGWKDLDDFDPKKAKETETHGINGKGLLVIGLPVLPKVLRSFVTLQLVLVLVLVPNSPSCSTSRTTIHVWL